MKLFLSRLMFLVFLLATILYFNISWIQPIYSERANPAYKYLPIHYFPETFDDDYFYYSRIREMIDGRILSGDHATVEHESEVTPHTTYSLSFLLGAIGGFITGKTQHAFYFNHIFYPALVFISLILFSSMLSLDIFLGLFLSALVVLKNPALFRTPNCLITSSFLIFLSMVLFQKFELQKKSRFFDACIVLLLGTSSLVSAPNFLISYGLLGAFLFFYQKSIKNWMGFIKIAVICLLLSAPGIYVMLKSILNSNSDFFNYAIPPLNVYHGFQPFFFELAISNFIVSPWPIILLFSFPHKRFYCVFLATYIFVYSFISIVDGSFLAAYLFSRGGECLYWFIAGAGTLQVLKAAILDGDLKVSFSQKNLLPIMPFIKSKAWRLSVQIIFFSALIYPASEFFNATKAQAMAAKKSKSYYNLPELSELADWAVKNVNDSRAALTLDFDVVLSLGIYTPIDTYLAFAHASPVITLERNRRLFETILFYGQNEEFLRDLLQNMIGHPQMSRHEPQLINLGLMQLVHFYGMYYDSKMRPGDVQSFVDEFRRVKISAGLSYKADFLIISTECAKFVKDGSPAQHLIQSSSPVFENAKYQVYSIARKHF